MTAQQPFRRLAIVNRAEATMRAIHPVRELNWERLDPIRLVALLHRARPARAVRRTGR